MPHSLRIYILAALLSLGCTALLAQTPVLPNELRIFVSEREIAFAPTRPFQEMRLQVFNRQGEAVFTHTTAEAEWRWPVKGHNNTALAPGLYAYVVTLSFAESEERQHHGHFIIEKGQDQLWLTTNDQDEIGGSALTASRSGTRTTAGTQTSSTDVVVTEHDASTAMATAGKTANNAVASPNVVTADSVIDGNIIFTPAGARDITMQNNAGGLRFYGAPALTTSPAAAAIQFWGNNNLSFPGQLYLDSGAHNNAALIFRTAGTGGTIAERMRLTSYGFLGIGTTAPTAKLHVVASGTEVGVKGESLGGVGYGVYGSSVDSVGVYGESTRAGGVFGRSTDASGVLGRSTTGDGVNGFSLNGNGLYGQSVNSYAGNFQGNVLVTGIVTQLSDRRLKQNIGKLGYGLTELLRLRPVTWRWKDRPERGLQLGLIAQEVETVLPELVSTEKNTEQTKGLNYTGLTPVLIKAMQEQQAQIQQLLRANQRLTQRLKRVERQLKTPR